MVEVLVSIVLCSICVLGIVALFRIQSSSSSFARRTTEATVLAEDKMEELRVKPIGSLAGGPEANLNEQGTATPAGPFNRSWTVVTTATYVDIIVTVAWTEDVPRSVILRGRRNL